MPTIERLTAMEILDSRGRPTVAATCVLRSGATGRVSVPSGASTGQAEAHELRDNDKGRYGGLGCRRAVGNVNGPIADAVRCWSLVEQKALDELLVLLDGTTTRSKLGANAILATSLAFARAHAAERGVPLYQHFADMIGNDTPRLPQLTINLFSGGKHAGGQVPIQDVLLVPVTARSIDEGLAMTYAVFQEAVRLTRSRYNARPLRADEGGLAPPFPDADAMLGDAVEAIRAARLEPGREMALAVDVASSHFYAGERYHLSSTREGEAPSGLPADAGLDSAGMIDQIRRWVDAYPIISVEDGLAETDWESWPKLRKAIGGRALVLGDDFLCTNPHRIRRAVEASACDALLLKVNQIGTLTEAAESLRLARSAGWRVTVSARSGETEDDWLADLAVGWAGDQIKIGSITQSERLAKYNRLLAIEQELAAA